MLLCDPAGLQYADEVRGTEARPLRQQLEVPTEMEAARVSQWGPLLE